MEVIGHARARGAALVDPGVDPLRVEGAFDEVGAELDQAPERRALRRLVIEQRGPRFAEGDGRLALRPLTVPASLIAPP